MKKAMLMTGDRGKQTDKQMDQQGKGTALFRAMLRTSW